MRDLTWVLGRRVETAQLMEDEYRAWHLPIQRLLHARLRQGQRRHEEWTRVDQEREAVQLRGNGPFLGTAEHADWEIGVEHARGIA